MRLLRVSNFIYGLFVGLVLFALSGFRADGFPVGEFVRSFPGLSAMKPAVWVVLSALVLPLVFTGLDFLVTRFRNEAAQGPGGSA